MRIAGSNPREFLAKHFDDILSIYVNIIARHQNLFHLFLDRS